MKFSVGTQLAAVTVAVLTLVTTLLVVGLASQERDRAIAEKSTAATMVTDLFAASVSAGVVFGDNDAVQDVLRNLARTDDVIGGAVFSGARGDVPMGTFGHAVPPSPSDGVTVGVDALVVSRVITDNEKHVVGRTSVVFSLARENGARVKTRRNLAAGGLLVMLLTAGLLLMATRSRVVRPLMRLASAATEIERGVLTNRPAEYANSEVADLSLAFNRMGDAVAERERRLKRELEVAADLQLSILPKKVDVEGIETAAMMKPATEVGGDYFDIIPTNDGCWIGIGDVSGHGLGAGVVMLMIQSAVSALVSANPNTSPVEVECVVNRVLYENVRERMGRREHATLSILRYTHDGRVRFAGAHEDIVVYRAATGTVETFETPGTWVGARRDVNRATIESELWLEEDDVMVLYTDGVTEAMRNREQLGFSRLVETVRVAASGTAHDVRDAIASMVAGWTSQLADDVSVVVVKQGNFVGAKEPYRADVLETGIV